ncbi:MAG: helix-turn-helix domain-containing protein [Gaiellaceae bacterium]
MCYTPWISLSEAATRQEQTLASLPTLLTVEEVAAILRCQPEKVYRLAARGILPSYKVEGRRLFDPRDITAYLSTCRQGPMLPGNGGR